MRRKVSAIFVWDVIFIIGYRIFRYCIKLFNLHVGL